MCLPVGDGGRRVPHSSWVLFSFFGLFPCHQFRNIPARLSLVSCIVIYLPIVDISLWFKNTQVSLVGKPKSKPSKPHTLPPATSLLFLPLVTKFKRCLHSPLHHFLLSRPPPVSPPTAFPIPKFSNWLSPQDQLLIISFHSSSSTASLLHPRCGPLPWTPLPLTSLSYPLLFSSYHSSYLPCSLILFSTVIKWKPRRPESRPPSPLLCSVPEQCHLRPDLHWSPHQNHKSIPGPNHSFLSPQTRTGTTAYWPFLLGFFLKTP